MLIGDQFYIEYAVRVSAISPHGHFGLSFKFRKIHESPVILVSWKKEQQIANRPDP